MAYVSAEGDVFGLPLSAGGEALCRVLFRSQYFRNVILVGAYGTVSGPDAAAQIRGIAPITLIYASCESLDRGQWRYIANVPLTEKEEEFSKRIVGGEVWLRDQAIGPASAEHLGLPQMDVHGDRVLIRKVEKAIAV